MIVKELIELLKTYPENLPVCYSKFSEYCMLEMEDIKTKVLGASRPDGWVAERRSDKPECTYLVLPGN